MKIKMPCKLCELSLDQQKMSRTGCNHHLLDYATPPYVPFSLEQLALQSNGLVLPQMRDMMLAACLLRGEKQEEFINNGSRKGGRRTPLNFFRSHHVSASGESASL